MSSVIYLADERPPAVTPPPEGEPLLDRRARPLRDLRISVTDRCNFRCTYCMPREVFDAHYRFMPHAALLSFEEITRAARIFVRLGTEKIRLTGGEPLLRKDIDKLIAMLAELRTPQGRPLDLTLTTNASLLARKARALKAAGLARVTVSLDALDPARFARLADADYTPDDVLAGIDAAAEAGLPVKVNMVVRRGVNDAEILPMARRFRHSGHVLRFIEYMDVGNSNGWNVAEVLPSDELLARLREHFALAPVDDVPMGRVAERWRYADGAGEIGLISSVTHAFCGGCTRARLSPEGQLFLCLFASRGHDVRALLRGTAGDEAIAAALAGIWTARQDNYSERRGQATAVRDKIEMSYIGG
ncbi:GTP 3',8-cyclase MoaA [Bordetella pseudohinzii]|uniref:GTP 3',8-cyclase n=1 Tax=Bordetella pseudohinzii TaxID=1331258 RepID=A0A0J6EXC8_9BORD|nr:GTP 3',8-cyclase MoaA [Bordetella pseudohinzii]ANY17097.1 cyclic pyranopterin phosphate synthase [Bordetella pseudohinzii]KMM25020.1 molybdenum cofactor biosynthesis protein MoeA [Bordetella pseudohinzii]KXA75616.1 cyclic pyranopterin phosphate synthase MoaA [Bordetella pseudohinzii]KXA77066.1 cyclic pyranopterin phosphate synthase MoaA [Bordetella pseudohinzii]CUI99933.1 Molybdenum cofactor biosynthesis protein A [Bordetella pseudohinzii]